MKIDKEAKEKFDYLASSICDKYCRYPFIWDEAKYGSLIDSEICCHCPITMFMEYVEVEGDRVPVNASEEAKAEALKMAADALKISSCDDVVSRQAVLDLMRRLKRWCIRSEDGKFNNVGLLFDDVMFGIDKLPPVRPQEQTGHWINHILSIECSYCGNKLFADDENENCEDYDAIDDLGYKFCPNCGCRMFEPQAERE